MQGADLDRIRGEDGELQESDLGVGLFDAAKHDGVEGGLAGLSGGAFDVAEDGAVLAHVASQSGH